MKWFENLCRYHYRHEREIPELKRKFGIVNVVGSILLSVAIIELVNLIFIDKIIKIIILAFAGSILIMISQSIHFIEKKRDDF